jgi:glycosyltransferase involved in cell wall biosynthesis
MTLPATSLVSVVVPTHNRPDLLIEALASVRAQTFTDYEIIVVSNGEPPENRARSEAAAINHGCVYYALDDGNVSAARNLGIAHARGKWIAFLDDDDIWLPEKLARQLGEAKRTGAAMVTCDVVHFCADGTESVDRTRPPPGWTHVKALNHQVWWSMPSATIVRKPVFNDAGMFDPAMRVGEDSDMWRRIAWRHRVHQMDEVLVRYRCGHASIMRANWWWRQMVHDLVYYRKMRRDTPAELRGTMPPVWIVCRYPLKRLRPHLLALRRALAGDSI